MLPEPADETTISSARPVDPAAREPRQLAHRLLREASLELARLRRIRGGYKRTARRILRARTRLALAAALLSSALAEPALAEPAFLPRFSPPPNPFGSGPPGNPFGFGSGGPTFADIDGDGDLDAFVGGYFFQNVGTASEPTFAPGAYNPFGAAGRFADIDGDGDLDSFGGGPTFFENTGTVTAPAFTLRSTSAFGVPPMDLSHGRASSTVADIDGDGDLDLFVSGYQSCGYGCGRARVILLSMNTGTATAPAFASPLTNPFGLPGGDLIAFVDIDGDGDLDAFAGDSNGITSLAANTGTASAPAFAPRLANPFGLTDVGFYASPAFADIDGDGDLDAFIGFEGYYRGPPGGTAFFENREIRPALGPSCVSSQLHALADLCSAQLRCRAQVLRSPNRVDRCLSESENKLSSALARGATASVKAGEVCPTDQAWVSASDLEASDVDLAAGVLEGADLSNRSDAALRAAITRDAGVLCASDLRVLAQETPSADAALLAARARFLGSAGKAIQKAERRGVSYDGLAPNAIADTLRALAEELADQLSP